ncbi:MAG TPA: UDP-2,4-diacetamido-2,4,6-trideoxy-beta-L-altropyranose hydrolase [Mucilaginibacter sp.]
MENKKISIRADGGSEIGLGHIVRCIALAQMLMKDFDINFVCKQIPETSIQDIKKLGFGFRSIKNEDEFLDSITADTIVVLDHYGLDTQYQKAIKEKGYKLVCIDDLHDKEFFADLIINHAPNIEPSAYQAQTYTQFALSLEYVLLRPAFLKKAKEAVNIKITQTAFVCFGGSDIKNITQTTVDILKKDTRLKKIIIVVGAGYNYFDLLKESVEDDARFYLYHSIDSEKMAELISESQLAIVPSSGILLEVLAIGCNIISGMYIENQKYVFDNFKSLGAFENAEDFSGINLTSAINKTFYKKSSVKKLIDGYSDRRLLNNFRQLVIEDEVSLKNAGESDLNKTFEWAGNAEIRKFSFNNATIDYDTHKKWFTGKVGDKHCYYFIGELNNEAFGSIRFDVENSQAKISYLIDPAYQNNGLGTILLKKGVELLLKQKNVKILIVWGEVFNENTASVKIFKKLGYDVKSNFSTNFIRFEKIIQS